jgi:hypothetical protein
VIPRHQTILFIVLLAASIVMGAVLWNLRERAHERLLKGEVSEPTQAPQVAPAEQATLMVANDADNTVTARVLTLPLPQNPEARARALLGKLFDLYAATDATHRVAGGASSVAQVFLVPIVKTNIHREDGDAGPSPASLANPTGQVLAGIETETLTILSICSTLHANFPDVTQVRFLVDGQQRPTLAGHADLTRTYLTEDTVPIAGAQP